MRNTLLLLISLLPCCIKVVLYRALGYDIGRKVKIGIFSILNLRKHAKLEDGSSIGNFTYIKSNNFNLGSHSRIASFTFMDTPLVKIGKDSLISSGVIIRSGHVSKQSELVIGDIVHIFPFVTIDCSKRVCIEDEAGIGPKCSIFTHSSYKSVLEGYKVTYGDVTIGKRVELTYSVFVAPGVEIGDDAVCAYGSYINKDIPAGVLAGGTPAVIKRSKEQIIGDIAQLDAKQILTSIIKEYTDNIELVNNRKPIPVVLCIDERIKGTHEGVIYLLFNSRMEEYSASVYGMFDISSKVCKNHGFKIEDFQGFRKFLSRYGIRFITQ